MSLGTSTYVSRAGSNAPERLPFQKYVTCPNFCVSLHGELGDAGVREVLARGPRDGRRRDEEMPWQPEIAVVLHHPRVGDVGARAPIEMGEIRVLEGARDLDRAITAEVAEDHR